MGTYKYVLKIGCLLVNPDVVNRDEHIRDLMAKTNKGLEDVLSKIQKLKGSFVFEHKLLVQPAHLPTPTCCVASAQGPPTNPSVSLTENINLSDTTIVNMEDIKDPTLGLRESISILLAVISVLTK